MRAGLTQAQALILPSFAEGLPVVLMEALAAAIRAMAATPAAYLVAMRQAARTRVLARHDMETEAAKLVTLFRQAQSGAVP